MRRSGCRVRLHDVVLRRTGNTVLVRSVMYHRSYAAKVIVRWRGRGGPLECRRLPWIVTRLGTFEHAPEQIDHEDKLRCDSDDRRVGNKCVEWNQFLQVSDFREL